MGFLALPGSYTVKLKVGDQEFSEPLDVRKDPRSAGTPNDIQEQLKREVFALLKERLAVQKAKFDEILKSDLPAFNKRLAEREIAGIVVPEIK